MSALARSQKHPADRYDDPPPISMLVSLLRCLECGHRLGLGEISPAPGYPHLGPDGVVRCEACDEVFPLIAGTVRMLPRPMRARLYEDYPLSMRVLSEAKGRRSGDVPHPTTEFELKQRTADSFAYEWQHFGNLREHWRKNFLHYMQPHDADSFAGRLVPDVGAGCGRHSFHAAQLGARVVAVDVGRAIDVARANLPKEVLTVQADAEHLPFAPGTFDFVMSIGVLHHLPDPQRALARIAPMASDGGHVHLYIYWLPERSSHIRLLRLVTAARRITVRFPPRVLHAFCVPLAGVLMATIVGPYRILRRITWARRAADALPLKAYADYPFGVLVNDQFDRLSAPLERRYTRAEAAGLMESASLSDVTILPNNGWIGDGRVTAGETGDSACVSW